jgi:uncharacterized protein
MAEAAAKEPSMEDILASIRKIIAQDDPRVKPDVTPVRVETLNGVSPSSHVDAPATQPAPSAAPQQQAAQPAQQPPQQNQQAAGQAPQAMGQPSYRTQTSPRPNSAVTLAALASQVRQEMPRGPAAPQAQPAPRAPAAQAAPVQQAAQAQPAPVQAAPAQTSQAAPAQPAPAQSYRPLEAVAQRAAQANAQGGMSLAALAASVASADQPAPPASSAMAATAIPQSNKSQTVPAQASSVGPRPGPAPTHANAAAAATAIAQATPDSRDAKPALAQTAEVNAFRDALVSPSTGRMVGDSMDRLRAAVTDDTSAKVEAVLRPMLREWLDANLPGLVERLVREEIERIARA